jgi:gluconolactonase
MGSVWLLWGIALVLLLAISDTGDAAAELPIAPDARVEQVATGFEFTEGPAMDGEGNLFFSDAPRSRIGILPAGGAARVWKTETRGANGMMFDRQGRLITCNSQLGTGGRSVTRFEKDGKVTVLASEYGGKKLNAPNDLAIDTEGRIYFTDPRYGKTDDLEQDRMAVYRIEPNGTVTRVVDDLEVPNGILISADQRTLYIADSNPRPGGNHTLTAYDHVDGTESSPRWKRRSVLHDFGAGRGIDGMKLDTQGRIFATAGSGKESGVYVFSPQGKLIQFVATPETATNCTWGGPGLADLYVTAGNSVYRVRTRTHGHLVYPPLRK